MEMPNRFLLLIALLVPFVLLAACKPPSPVASGRTSDVATTDQLEPAAIGTITRLHTQDGVWLASQPAPDDLERLEKIGVRTVINQRHASENPDFDERAVVTALGMEYENPAWNGPDELTDDIIDETRRLLRTAERPVLLHCSSANRTGAIWFAYRALDDGLSVDEALAEARLAGLRSPEYERIVSAYVARRR